MTKYILKRVGYSIVTLFLLVAITFFMMQLLPGDPFTGEKQLPAAQMEALYAKYGLDKPVWQQFFIYIGNVVQGDLGVSLTYNRAVTLMITEAFAISFDVGIRSICFAFIGGVLLGTLAAIKRGKAADTVAMIIALLGVSVPSFVVASASRCIRQRACVFSLLPAGKASTATFSRLSHSASVLSQQSPV